MILVVWIVYCYYEGLTLTSDLARPVLLYLFRGKCSLRALKRGCKEDDPIKAIRKQYIFGTYTFAKCLKYFEPLTKYLSKHKAEVLPLLTDTHGKLTPTKEFLVMTEKCLRAVGLAPRSPLGHLCMKSGKDWDNVEPFKKEWMWAEWVITKALGLESQNRWTNANWARVKLRRSIHGAFKKHILPISDSLAAMRFRGQKIRDPACWSEKLEEPSPKTVRTAKTGGSSTTLFGSSSQPIDLWSDSDDDVVAAASSLAVSDTDTVSGSGPVPTHRDSPRRSPRRSTPVPTHRDSPRRSPRRNKNKSSSNSARKPSKSTRKKGKQSGKKKKGNNRSARKNSTRTATPTGAQSNATATPSSGRKRGHVETVKPFSGKHVRAELFKKSKRKKK